MKQVAAVVFVVVLCLSMSAVAGGGKAPDEYNAALAYESFICQAKSSIADSKSRAGEDASSAYDDLIRCINDAKASGKAAYKKLVTSNPSIQAAAKNYLVAYMTFLDSLHGAPPIDVIMASDAKRKLDAASNAFEVAGL
jgi:hypothetical protein